MPCVVLVAVPAQAGAAGRAALERYRPELRYDSGERHFAQEVSPPGRPAREGGAERLYGHVAREGGKRWLQYWLFYRDNPQDRGIFRTGRHEGDWEFIQLRLGAGGTPDLVTLAQHSWAEGCPWRRLRRVRAGGVELPVVYVANASHASYSRPGVHDRPFPDHADEADGRGRRLRPPLVRIDDAHPDWVAWRGRWGGSRAGFIPGEQDSPKGPRFQEDGRWSSPSRFHRELAIPCGSRPPRRAWQTALTVFLALLLTAAAVALLRRRLGRDPGARRMRLRGGDSA